MTIDKTTQIIEVAKQIDILKNIKTSLDRDMSRDYATINYITILFDDGNELRIREGDFSW